MATNQGYRPKQQQRKPATTRSSTTANSRKKAPVRNTRKPPAKRKRKKRNTGIKVFFLLLVLAVVATGVVMGIMLNGEIQRVLTANTFFPGVYIDGVELYGATPMAAYEYLMERKSQSVQDFKLDLTYGDKSWTITSETIGLNASISSIVQDEVNKAFMVGRDSTSFFSQASTLISLRSEPYQAYTTSGEKSMETVDAIISSIQAEVYRAPVDASMQLDATRKNPVVVVDEQYGQELDAAALKAQVTDRITKMESGTIQVQPKQIAPTIMASSLTNEFTLIGSYSSKINSRSTENRNLNIEKGCAAFNGKVIKPGEKVSFNKYTGLRNEKNGYFPAEEIVSGSYEMGWGGGICQVSSALYNAVIKANLKVVDRTNHGIPVNYMEMGADATVYDNRIDFVFENNTGADIYISARLESNSNGKSCVFQIYGRPDPNGYTYELRHETIEEIPIPEPTRVPDKDQTHVVYRDEEYQATKGQKGYVVRTYLVTRDANGTVVSDEFLYKDTYKAQAPRIYVGTEKRPE